MRRRDFLKSAGCFVATASMGGVIGCGDDDDRAERGDAGPGDAGKAGPGRYTFPHGVASGDPRAASVMLWTRVAAADAGQDRVPLKLEVATDSGFKQRVLAQELEASADADYTVRVLVEGLEADTVYYYRFIAGADASRQGRTWTAPKPSADVAIHFAWVSCQDYKAGFYGAYRRLLNDDAEAARAEQLRFVLHVGDFIYETRNAAFQSALDEDLTPIELRNPDGKSREVPPFPSGGGKRDDTEFAQTVDDYRHLYKTFLGDTDLQDARAHWPFVNMWDDHEFSDDCWQSQTNYTNDKSFDEPSQQRRVAASQAWFEYTPAILSDGESADGVDNAAKDFEPVSVENAEYSDPIDVDEPNNAKAIGAMSIYRRLRFGKHVDLVLTDNRSYRSDHAVPEDITYGNAVAFHPRAALPLEAVNAFDAGKTANGGNPPETVSGYMNTRRDSAPGTLLGDAQKQWFKDALSASSATFKVWGNSIPLLRLLLDATTAPLFPGDLVMSTDGWDGYASERRELMTFIKEQGIRNVVSLSGDHHAHYAGLVYDDYDGDDPTPVMTDFCAAGISSTSQFASIAAAVDDALGPDPAPILKDILRLIVFDATEVGGTRKAVPNLNTLIRFGGASALAMADSNDLEMAIAARKDSVNPHLRYTDSEANGYGLAAFGADSATITLVTIERPVVDRGADGAKVRGEAVFELPLQGADDEVALDDPTLSGDKPFPES